MAEAPMEVILIKEIPTTAMGDTTDHTRKITTSNPTVEEVPMVEEIATAAEADKGINIPTQRIM